MGAHLAHFARGEKKVNAMHRIRDSSYMTSSEQHGKNTHWRQIRSTMADSATSKATHLAEDISMRSPHQDESNDTINVMGEDDLMDFHNLGGAVSSPVVSISPHPCSISCQASTRMCTMLMMSNIEENLIQAAHLLYWLSRRTPRVSIGRRLFLVNSIR